MKRVSNRILVLVMILSLYTVAQASDFVTRGSAIVPGLRTGYSDSSSTRIDSNSVFITNITGSDVDVRMTVYDHDGNDITNYCSVKTGNTGSASPTIIASGTGEFELPAGNTRFVYCRAPTQGCYYGHGVIEWSSSDLNLRQALVAAGFHIYHWTVQNMRAAASISVNNGQPF
ncbi:MAG: hypothetical protein MI799_02385 [Desulfobacterales bacterium]|nr:hypothetical protein [Desulfobacterales bacterium]